MLLVRQQRPRVTGIPEVVAVVTFHVYGNPAQVTASNHRFHASRHVAKLLVELFGHERLTVTHPNDLTFFYPLDLRGVRISDLAASHDGDLKHTVHPARRPRHTAAVPLLWVPLASSPAWSSVFRCYNSS